MRHAGADSAEQGAALLTAAGMPRMPARVMMALVGSPDEGYSAAELADRLGVSAAAVSGAVNYLQSLHMIQRLSRPGDRIARYDLIDDSWHAVVTGRVPLLERLADAVERIAAENAEAPASTARAQAMAQFFRFVASRMPELIDEWDRSRLSD